MMIMMFSNVDVEIVMMMMMMIIVIKPMMAVTMNINYSHVS